MVFWKGRQKQQKTKWDEKTHFKTGLLWEQIDKKPLKMQENNHFVLFWTKQKHRNTKKRKQNHQNQKSDQKKHLFAFWQTTPYVC